MIKSLIWKYIHRYIKTNNYKDLLEFGILTIRMLNSNVKKKTKKIYRNNNKHFRL